MEITTETWGVSRRVQLRRKRWKSGVGIRKRRKRRGSTTSPYLLGPCACSLQSKQFQSRESSGWRRTRYSSCSGDHDVRWLIFLQPSRSKAVSASEYRGSSPQTCVSRMANDCQLRAQWILLGLACGDALGRPVEFQGPDQIERTATGKHVLHAGRAVSGRTELRSW